MADISLLECNYSILSLLYYGPLRELAGFILASENLLEKGRNEREQVYIECASERASERKRAFTLGRGEAGGLRTTVFARID